jgi:hypothetical protein
MPEIDKKSSFILRQGPCLLVISFEGPVHGTPLPGDFARLLLTGSCGQQRKDRHV